MVPELTFRRRMRCLLVAALALIVIGATAAATPRRSRFRTHVNTRGFYQDTKTGAPVMVDGTVTFDAFFWLSEPVGTELSVAFVTTPLQRPRGSVSTREECIKAVREKTLAAADKAGVPGIGDLLDETVNTSLTGGTARRGDWWLYLLAIARRSAYWLIGVGAVGFWLWLSFDNARALARSKTTACAVCGYSLTGIDVTAACPECGQKRG